VSVRAVSWAMEVGCPSPTAKLVLIVLAEAHNGHSGDCFPSIPRIVKTTGLSESGVKGAIRNLEAAGLIARAVERDETGRTKGVNYRLGCDGGRGREETPGGRQETPGEGAPGNPTRGREETPRGGARKPHSIDEPEKGTGRIPEDKARKRAGRSSKIFYPPEYELLWAEFPHHQNASKCEPLKTWWRLDEVDREACLQGAMAYADWLGKERQRRPDYPALHLATFINQRRWEAHLETAA
jgi:hypothetical protein